MQQAKIAATDGAFAIWCHGGERIVRWGHILVATALQSAISSGMCGRFTPQVEHLLQSWQMDLSLLGATLYDGGGSFDVQDQLRNV